MFALRIKNQIQRWQKKNRFCVFISIFHVSNKMFLLKIHYTTHAVKIKQTTNVGKWMNQSGQITNITIFHQPRFCWNKGISLPQLPFGGPGRVRSRPNLTRLIIYTYSNSPNDQCFLFLEPTELVRVPANCRGKLPIGCHSQLRCILPSGKRSHSDCWNDIPHF